MRLTSKGAGSSPSARQFLNPPRPQPYETPEFATAAGDEQCYSRSVRTEDLIAFAQRDWSAIAAHKRRRWAEQKSRMRPGEALSVGDELRHHVSALRDDWPTEEDRPDGPRIPYPRFGDAP